MHFCADDAKLSVPHFFTCLGTWTFVLLLFCAQIKHSVASTLPSMVAMLLLEAQRRDVKSIDMHTQPHSHTNRHTPKESTRNAHWLKKREKSWQTRIKATVSHPSNVSLCFCYFIFLQRVCFLDFCICFYFAIIIVCHEPNQNNHVQTKTVKSNRRNFIALTFFFFILLDIVAMERNVGYGFVECSKLIHDSVHCHF